MWMMRAMMRRAFYALFVVLSAGLASSASLSGPSGGTSPVQAGSDGPRVPPGFRAAPNATAEPLKNTEWAREVIHEKTGLAMVFVPAGSFEMRSKDLKCQVKITRPFYMAKYEVSNAEFRKFRPQHSSGTKIDGRTDLNGDAQPVVRVSWDDASAYVSWAGLRLPTEAEWEYACRAGTTTEYPFGNRTSGLGRYAWYNHGLGRTRLSHPGGEKLPNAWGLYDMLGNVWEWCSDWYLETYFAQFSSWFPNTPFVDPPGPPTGERRALRGGSWASNPEECTPGERRSRNPEDAFEECGIRPVYSIDIPGR